MIPKDGGQVHQRRGVPLGNEAREMHFEGDLRVGQRVGLLSLSFDVRCMCVYIRCKPHSPELQFAPVASELPEQAMDVLPVLFASVPDAGWMVIQLDQREPGSKAPVTGQGGAVVRTSMICRAHHEPDPAPAPDPRASAEFSDFGVPVIVTEEPVVFETVVLYLAETCSHIDHPSAGDPAPGSIWERVVGEGEVWVVCTGGVVVGYCEWAWIGREEGERRIERCGEEGDPRRW